MVLERLEKTTKLYLINLNDGATNILGGVWDDLATYPTLELKNLSAADSPVKPLAKKLLFNSLNDLPDLVAKQESLAYYGGGFFQLINDNDFSILGDKTHFTQIWLDPADFDY